MKSVVRIAATIAVSVITACGGGRSTPAPPTTPPPTTPPPTAPPPPTDSPTTITGREHIAWGQPAEGLAGYVFLLFVDGVRNELPQASCSAAQSGVFDCDSPLPPMINGLHMLQLAAAVRQNDALVEGARSESMTVNVNGSSAATGDTLRMGGGMPRASLERLQSQDTSDVRDTAGATCGLTGWDDTGVLAWSSRGELAVVDVRSRQPRALTWEPDVTPGAWRLLSAARRRDAGRSLVYAVFASRDNDAPIAHVVRYREIDGVLGERAVLVERTLDDQPARASAAFGPDGLLYVSFAWQSMRTVEAPFVMTVDTGNAHPGTNGVFDPRFLSRGPISTTWDADDRFWILESGGDGYIIRSTDATAPAWRIAATEPPLGVEALGRGPVPPRLAVFAGNGPGWLLSGGGAEARVSLGAGARQAAFVLGGTLVSCQAGPQLTFTYAAWRE
jgi:hypothetical protein